MAPPSSSSVVTMIAGQRDNIFHQCRFDTSNKKGNTFVLLVVVLRFLIELDGGEIFDGHRANGRPECKDQRLPLVSETLKYSVIDFCRSFCTSNLRKPSGLLMV